MSRQVVTATRDKMKQGYKAEADAVPTPSFPTSVMQHVLPDLTLSTFLQAMEGARTVAEQSEALGRLRVAFTKDIANTEEKLAAVSILLGYLSSENCAPLARHLLSTLCALRSSSLSTVGPTIHEHFHAWMLEIIALAKTPIVRGQAVEQGQSGLVAFALLMLWTLFEEKQFSRQLVLPSLQHVAGSTDEYTCWKGIWTQIFETGVSYFSYEIEDSLALISSESISALSSVDAIAILHAADRANVSLKLLGTILNLDSACKFLPFVKESCAHFQILCQQVALLDDILPKDVVIASAMLLTTIWTHIAQNKSPSDFLPIIQLVCAFFAPELQCSVDADLQQAVEWWKGCSNPVTRTAILRGLMVSVPPHVLSRIVPWLSSGCVHFGPILDYILHICEAKEIKVRLFAVQTLEAWIQIAGKIVELPSSEETKTTLPLCVLQRVLTLVLENWSHPDKRITAMMTPLFDSLLELIQKIAVAPSSSDADGKDTVSAATLLRTILDLSQASPIRYSGLTRLLRLPSDLFDFGVHGKGALGLLFETPQLLEDILYAVGGRVPIGSIPTTAFFTLLTTLRQQLETIAGLPVGNIGGNSAVWQRGIPSAAGQTNDDGADASALKKRKKTKSKTGKENEYPSLEALYPGKQLNLVGALRLANCLLPVQKQILNSQNPIGEVSATLNDYKSQVHATIASRIQDGSLPDDLKTDLIREAMYYGVYQVWLQLWLPSFLSFLTHPTREIRLRMFTYLIKDLIGMDSTTYYEILSRLPSSTPFIALPTSPIYWAIAGVNKDSFFLPAEDPEGDDLSSSEERKVWAIVALSRMAKALGAIQFSDNGDLVPTDVSLNRGIGVPDSLVLPSEIIRQYIHFNDLELAATALELFTEHLSSATIPTQVELDLAIEWIRRNLLALPEIRKRILRAIQLFLTRLLNGLQVVLKDHAKAVAYANANSKSTASPAGGSADNTPKVDTDGCAKPPSAASLPEVVQHCKKFVEAMFHTCFQALTPGASADRIAFPLELLNLLLDIFGDGLASSAHPSQPRNAKGSKNADADSDAKLNVQQILFETVGIAQFFLESKDHARVLVEIVVTQQTRLADIALRLLRIASSEHVLPGYSTSNHRKELLRWALHLTQSPRDRESYAGALFLELVYHKFVHSELPLDFLSEEILSSRIGQYLINAPLTTSDDRSKVFVLLLLAHLVNRSVAFSYALYHMFHVAGPYPLPSELTLFADGIHGTFSPLSHGLIQALRTILRSLPLQSLAKVEAEHKTPFSAFSLDALQVNGHSLPHWRQIVCVTMLAFTHVHSLVLCIIAGTAESDNNCGGPESEDAPVPSAGGEDGLIDTEEMVVVTKGRIDCAATSKVSGRGNGTEAATTGASKGTLLCPVSNSVDQLDSNELRKNKENTSGYAAVTDIHATARGDGLVNAAQLDSLVRELDAVLQDAVLQDAVETEKDADLHAIEEIKALPSKSELSIKRVSHAMVVASWLSSREVVYALGELVTQMPLPPPQSDASQGTSTCPDIPFMTADIELPGTRKYHIPYLSDVWTADDRSLPWLIPKTAVRYIGNALLSSLLQLRHVGSISSTAEAFQSLCTKLLTTPLSDCLTNLPYHWQEELLHLITLAQQFILRRSAGFSQAFVTLLRAEPKNLPERLFPRAIVQLLRIAGASDDLLSTCVDLSNTNTAAPAMETEDSTNTLSPRKEYSWRSAVHALNVLRLLFRDGYLGEAIFRYTPAGLTLSLQGFTSRAWSIRNSSMMLFAAVLDRCLGVIGRACSGYDVTDPKSVLDSQTPTLTTFFSRFPPSLQQFVLQELTACTTLVEGSRILTHPNLYPALLFFSRFRPDLASDDDSAAHQETFAKVIPAFLASCTHHHAFVREMAARAMVASVHPTDYLPHATVHLQKLLNVAQETGVVESTAVHGLFALLTNCFEAMEAQVKWRAMDATKRKAARVVPLLSELRQPMKDALRLIRDATLPCTVRDICLRSYVAWNKLRYAIEKHWKQQVALQLLSEKDLYDVCESIFAEIPSLASNLTTNLGRDMLIRTLCNYYVDEYFSVHGQHYLQENVLHRIVALVASPIEDMRLYGVQAISNALQSIASITVLLKHVDPVDQTMDVNTQPTTAPVLTLVETLLSRLRVEAHPEVLFHALSALLALSDMVLHTYEQPGTVWGESCGSDLAPTDVPSKFVHFSMQQTTWASLLRGYQLVGDPNGQAIALRLFSTFLRVPLVLSTPLVRNSFLSSAFFNVPRLFTHIGDILTRTVKSLDTHTTRIASCEFLRSSGVLTVFHAAEKDTLPLALRQSALPLLFALLHIIQDIDDEVRAHAVRAIHTVVASIEQDSSSARVEQLVHAKESVTLIPAFGEGERICQRPVYLTHERAALLTAYSLLVTVGKNQPDLVPSLLAFAESRVLSHVRKWKEHLGTIVEEYSGRDHAWKGPSSNEVPDVPDHYVFSTGSLLRATFLPDKEQTYQEDCVVAALDAGLWKALEALGGDTWKMSQEKFVLLFQTIEKQIRRVNAHIYGKNEDAVEIVPTFVNSGLFARDVSTFPSLYVISNLLCDYLG